jgi:hypothetical protein
MWSTKIGSLLESKDPKSLTKILVTIVLVILLSFATYYVGYQIYDKYFADPPPVVELPANVPLTNVGSLVIQDAVNKALKDAGVTKTISKNDAQAIKDKMIDRTENTVPDKVFAAPGSESGVKEIKKEVEQIAKDEGRDVVVKSEQEKAVNYYGITLDKKVEWSIYYDLSDRGSVGIGYKNDRLGIDVGQRKDDKQVDVRVRYVVKRL